jgi:hypothetical protein
MPDRRSLLAALMLAGFGAFALPACAAGSLVDLQIVDRTQGHLLDAYRQRGTSWVAGQPGNRYGVQMTNRSGGRVLVVLSIDGINAISGDTAAVGQTGYVLGPWESAEITGWRKSSTEAAAFYFTALADSYAARTDRPDNVGVIGAAVFRERPPVRPESRLDIGAQPFARKDAAAERSAHEPASPTAPADALARRQDAPAMPAASPAATAQADSRSRAAGAMAEAREADASVPRKAQRLGTGHGEREYSPISQVAFERATTQPAEVVQVRYDSRRNLVALGIIGGRVVPPAPEAFPRFVPDPR